MQAIQVEGYGKEEVLYMAMELSWSRWRIAFGGKGRSRQVTLQARDRQGVLEEIRKAKEKFGLSAMARVVSCYEAGRDGFWIHRWLLSCGMENVVVDATSIEVSRRARRVKTDRVDAQKLLLQLQRYWGGEKQALRVVNVPSEAAEDGRRMHRERQRLLKESGMHRSRIAALLAGQGVEVKLGKHFDRELKAVRLWDGSAIGAGLEVELLREWRRWIHVQEQLRALETQQEAELEQQSSTVSAMRRLTDLRGIGSCSAWILDRELFGWREFSNRRQLAACVGLTPTPYSSGGSEREQGISKAGNRRVRALLIEVSWFWLRYQPASALSAWYARRFGSGGARARRIGIVALARRLLVALWRYVKDGVVPEGAVLKVRECAAG